MANYKIITLAITEAGKVQTNGANAVIFINRGGKDAIINNETITTDQSVNNNGLQNEIDTTEYKITFSGTGTQLVYCRYKVYNS